MPAATGRVLRAAPPLLCLLTLALASTSCEVVGTIDPRRPVLIDNGAPAIAPGIPGAPGVPAPSPPPPYVAPPAPPAAMPAVPPRPPGQDAGPPAPASAGPVVPGACTGGVLPGQIRELLTMRCLLCHGSPPLPTVPGSLATIEDLRRPSKSDPGRTMAEMMLARIRNVAAPMPPAPGQPLSADEAGALEGWVRGGLPLEGCTSAPPGGPGALDPARDAGPPPMPRPPAGPDPFAAAPVCTSRSMYTGGEGPRMRPGDACISCHRRDDGPNFQIGGTVYPTAHEPSRCNGADAQGAVVTVTDAAGQTVTAQVNAAGNFYTSGRNLRPPFRAKVAFNGKERLMIGAVPVGDCNICHTQNGTTIVTGGPKAPGRILLP